MTEPPQLPNVQIEISQEVGSGDATGMKVGEIKGSVTIYQTGSVASLSPDYATRIQNFFNEYSGTPKEPVPFGGREQEIELLDTWLDNDKAPPYLLLAAPAGRGKSALLVNWNKHLLAKQNIAVVFFPVSIRFRTNLASVVFAAIAAQLAALHGEKISGTLNTPVEDWRGIMSGYLNRPLSDGHRLLVIIDGLDEAVDWDAGADLFPSNPPKGLRIVVSARYLAGHKDAVSWLRILGWNKPGLAYTPNLLPLTKEGLADVLRKMGCPLDQLGARVDIVGELHRLSEGDPLLVRLYVDDLWKRGNEVIRLRPEDLQGIAPGLDGYFSNWWEYQCKLWGKEAPLKETGVRTFFYLLASSLGPLYQKDILNLVPKESKLTDSLILEETLKPLARLVIGDGRYEGYAFSHPRLGIYFYEKYASDCKKIESQILLVGKQTLEALNREQVLPQNVSPYIVQYYSSHLVRLNCDVELLLSLVSDGWRLAWEALDGTYSGFINDVEKAWLALERADRRRIQTGKQPLFVGDVVRCALCLASINSLYQDISPAMVKTLVEKRIWTPQQALTYTQRLQNPKQRVKTLVELESCLPDLLKKKGFATVLKALLTIDDEESKNEVLLVLIPLLPKTFVPEILKLIQSISNNNYHAELLIKLAPRLPETFVPEALSLAQSIDDMDKLMLVLTDLSYRLHNPLNTEILVALGTEQGTGHLKSLRLLWLVLAAVFFASAGLAKEALETVKRALVENDDEFDEVILLTSIAYILFFLGYLQEACEAIQAIKQESVRAETLIELLPKLSASSLLATMRIIEIIEDQQLKAEVISKLSLHLVEAGCLEDAFTAIQEIEEEEKRAETLIELLPKLSASSLLATMRIIKTIEDKQLKADVISELSSHLVEAGCPEDAFATIQEIEEEERAEALHEIFTSLPNPSIPKALNLIKKVNNEWLKIKLLTEISSHLPQVELKKLIQDIIEIPDQRRHDTLLKKLSLHLVKSGRPKAALAAVKTITHKSIYADTIVIILPYLPESLLSTAMIQVKSVLKIKQHDSISEEENSTNSWTQIVITAFCTVKNQNLQTQLLSQLSAEFLKSNYPREALQAIAGIKDLDKRNQTLGLWITNLSKRTFELLLSDLVFLAGRSKQVNLILSLLERIKKNGNQENFIYRIVQLSTYLIDLGFYSQIDKAVQVISNNEDYKGILRDYLVYNFIFKNSDLAWLIYQRIKQGEMIKNFLKTSSYLSNFYLFFLSFSYSYERRYFSYKRRNNVFITIEELWKSGLIQEGIIIYKIITLEIEFIEDSREIETLFINLYQSGYVSQMASLLLELEKLELNIDKILVKKLFSKYSLTKILTDIQTINDENLSSKFLLYLSNYKHLNVCKYMKLIKATQIVGGKNVCTKEVWSGLELIIDQNLINEEDSIENNISKKIITNLCLCLSASGRLQEAFIIAQLIDDKNLEIELATKLNLSMQKLRSLQDKDTLTVTEKVNIKNNISIENNEQVLTLASIIQEHLSLTSLQTIKIDNQDKDLLVNQISCLSEPQKENLLREILQHIETIEDKDEQDKIIGQLLQYLPEQILQSLLDTKRQIKDQNWQTKALISLIPDLPASLGIDLQRQLFEDIKAMEPEYNRGEVLVKVVPYLPQLLPEALELAYQIKKNDWRVIVVAGVASHLTEPLKRNILKNIFDTVNTLEDEYWRASILAELVPYLPISLLKQVIETGKNTQDVWAKLVLSKKLSSRLEALSEFSENSYFDSASSENLGELQFIKREDISAWLLKKIASNTTNIHSIDILQNELERVLENKESGELQKALELARLIPNFPQSSLQHAVAASLAIQGITEKNILLPHLLSNLHLLPASEVLEVLKTNQKQLSYSKEYHELWCANVLSVLLIDLPESLLPEALFVLQKIEDKNLQAKVLKQLVKRLADLGYVQAGFMGIRILRKKENLSYALASFKIQPLSLPRVQMFPQIIQKLERIPDVLWRVRFLAGVARHLPDKTGLLEKALTTARAINQQHKRAEALLIVAPHLTEAQKNKVLQEALNASKAIKAELAQCLIRWDYWHEVENALQALEEAYERSETLGKSISATNNPITDNVWEKVLLLIAMVETTSEGDDVLVELALGLSKLGYLQKSLTVLLRIKDCQRQVYLLIYIALCQQEPYKGKLLLKAKDLAGKIEDKGEQIIALIQIGLHLPELTKAKILKQAVLTLKTIKSQFRRSQVLSKVTTHLAAIGCIEQVTIALQQMETEYIQGNLHQKLQGDIWHKLLLVIRLMENNTKKAELFFHLASLLPNSQKEELQQEALETALAIDDKYQKASVLMWMTFKLPKSNRNKILNRTIEAVGAIDDEVKRTKILSKLVRYLNSLPIPQLYNFWSKLLHLLSTRTRKDLLADLCTLSTIAKKLGTSQSVEEIADAILEVSQWWP